MTAKEYLAQIQMLDLKIAQKEQEAAQLRSTVTGRGRDISERVQTSPKSAQESVITRYLDMEDKINSMVDKYIVEKDLIINQIHKLTDTRYIKILYDHYVPDANHKVKSLEAVAAEMGFHYNYVRHLHGKALLEFARVTKLSTK